MSNAGLSFADEIRTIALHSGAEALYYGPIEDRTVLDAEAVLGVKFPPSYRAYLRHLGAAKILNYDFDGLPDNSVYVDEPPLFLNVVEHTLMFREEINFFTKTMVYLTDDGGPVMYYLETAILYENQECPVFAHLYGQKVLVASSFIKFIQLLSNKQELYESLKNSVNSS